MDTTWVDDVHAAVVDQGQDSPCLLAGAAERALGHLPSAEHVDAVLSLRALNPATVRMVRGGTPVPSQAYLRNQKGYEVVAAVDPVATGELMRTGATLSVNDFHHIEPRSAALVDAVEDAFATTAEAVLFVTPAGNAGFRPHADLLDVIVVQTVGTKDWKVWSRPDGPAANRDHDAEELGAPILEVTLEPGDVLFLPGGTPHAASATQELSVHVSLGMSGRDTITVLLRELATLTETAVPEPAAEVADRFASLRTSLEQAARDGATAIRRRVRPVSELAHADLLTGHSVVRTRTGVLDVLQSDRGDIARVKANGVTMDMPATVAELVLSERASARGFCANELPLPSGGLPTKLRLLKKLHRLGIVERC